MVSSHNTRAYPTLTMQLMPPVLFPLQAYLARRLDIIHYQISKGSLQSFLISVRLSNTEVIFISSTNLVGTYDDFLKIDNRPGIYHSQTFFPTRLSRLVAWRQGKQGDAVSCIPQASWGL